jgi:hypothetical protein
MRVLVTGAYHSIQVRYPMSELRGSCLASTAVLHSLAEEQLWLHWLTHRGLLTRGPSLLSMPNKGHCDRPRTFYPGTAFLPGTRSEETGKEPVGEPSLFSEEKCLSLHPAILSDRRKTGNGERYW